MTLFAFSFFFLFTFPFYSILFSSFTRLLSLFCLSFSLTHSLTHSLTYKHVSCCFLLFRFGFRTDVQNGGKKKTRKKAPVDLLTMHTLRYEWCNSIAPATKSPLLIYSAPVASLLSFFIFTLLSSSCLICCLSFFSSLVVILLTRYICRPAQVSQFLLMKFSNETGTRGKKNYANNLNVKRDDCNSHG